MLVADAAAEKATCSPSLVPKCHCPSLPLSSSKETWKKKEREVWCSRTRQARANRQRRKATAGHVITTHPREAVSGGAFVETVHKRSGSLGLASKKAEKGPTGLNVNARSRRTKVQAGRDRSKTLSQQSVTGDCGL